MVAARQALIIDGVRTSRGRDKSKGGLCEVHPQELSAQLRRALAERTGIAPVDVEDIVVRIGDQCDQNRDGIGMLAVPAAGWRATVPGRSVNRFCGSSQQAETCGRYASPSALRT